jgi:xanthine dehydrogenase accessory factor
VRDVLQAALDELGAGRRVVLATVVSASGSTPRGVGAKMIVRADGSTVGTIGGGAFEAMVTQDAADLLRDPRGAACVKRYRFTETGEDALGMACGGTAHVLLDPGGPGERLVVFGAGHVGLALARLAGGVGFTVDLVDDRESACAAARAARVGTVHHCDPDYAGGVPPLDPSCAVAIVTRCHRTDVLALERVIAAPVRYLGLIGSRRKKAVIFARLRAERGATDAELDRVRCPIGLPLGGDSPEEIAVSIVAELLQERGRTVRPRTMERPAADTDPDAPASR